MRRGITSRYNDKSWPLLVYLAQRLECEPKDAQRVAVVAMAREMIRRDKELADANPSGVVQTSGPSPVPSDGPAAPAVDVVGSGPVGTDGGVAGRDDGASTAGPG